MKQANDETMRIEPHSDLTIEITGIEFTPTQILIDAFPLHTKKDRFNPYKFSISRALNGDIVKELKIGNWYRIIQERHINSKDKVQYKWLRVQLLNNGTQLANRFNELFD